MTKSKHTPGSWVAGSNRHILTIETTAFVGESVIEICDVGSPNALLIAAAPELLDACKLLLDDLKHNGRPSYIAILTNVIAKAEGNSNENR